MITRKLLILIRHASTKPLETGEVERRDYNELLSEEGRRQAEALARRLSRIPVDTIYSSPMPRALLTAHGLGKGSAILEPALGDVCASDYQELQLAYTKLAEFVDSLEGNNIIVVSHGTPIALILCLFMRASYKRQGRWGITPASISVIQNGIVVAMNDTSHLNIRPEQAEYDPHTWTYREAKIARCYFCSKKTKRPRQIIIGEGQTINVCLKCAKEKKL